METLKIVKFWNFWSIRGHFRHSLKIVQKFDSPKISTNTYHTKLNIGEMNFVGDTLQFECEFGALQILFKVI